MTEAAFRGWIRSQLRRMSLRWRPIGECKRAARRPVTPKDREKYGNRIKWVYECALCHNRVPDKLGQVDHIIPCGSLTDIEKDAGPFILRLLCESEGLRFLCDQCHTTITKEQRENTSPRH
jgi:ribosomal protein L44E